MSHYGNEEISISGLKRLIDKKQPKCLCGTALRGDNVTYGPHKGGVRIQGMTESQWVFVRCDKCGYKMALWKISKTLRGDKW